mgnify:CR=1 FL=1
MEKLALLKTSPARIEAHIIQQLLLNNGIASFLQFNAVGDALLGGVAMSNGPTDVYVKAECLKQAKELLDTIDN